MSELQDAGGMMDKPDTSGTDQPPPEAPAEQPRSANSADDELTREVDAAMAAMDESDLAELTGSAAPVAAGDGSSGQKQTGTIVGIYEGDVFIDLGGKTQAIAPRSHFGKEEILEIGRKIEVVVERFDPDSGCLVVSREGAIREAKWESLQAGILVEGRITGMNKGGLEVDLNGIRAFMPASQVDVQHIKDISVLIGQKVPCEIIEINRAERNVLVSRKKVMQKDAAEQKEQLLSELAEGQIRKGVIGNLTEFGAFVNLGGVDGLIHISDMSYGKVAKVTDVVKAGQAVEVKILKVDKKRNRISLGLKQTQPDPWQGVDQKYPVGTQATVRVLRLERFGAFAELEEGVDGLIPLSEMSWGRISKAADVVQVGQMVTAAVIRVEPDERRIALSIKEIEADPWAMAVANFPENAVCKGKVTKCETFGAFVELAPGVEGLVHISELSSERVKRCEDVVKPGDEIEVRVLGIDSEARRISLSIKAVAEAVGGEAEAIVAAESKPKPKRKKPLRGGLSSHFDWQGLKIDP